MENTDGALARATAVTPLATPPRLTAAGRRLSPTRERLLRSIERRGEATVHDLVTESGLHENTVRGHLDRLFADGYLVRRRNPPHGRGRPSTVWSPNESASLSESASPSPYEGLAITLAAALGESGSDAAERARSAGRTWGEALAREHEGSGDARTLVFEMMREHGFAPEDTGSEITLRHCPLRAAVTDGSAVVCAAHEGMVQGIAGTVPGTGGTAPGIAGTRSDGEQVTLLPFAHGSACALHVPIES